MKKTAIVLMNLGGPDSLEAVEPFLYNIFSDPDVIQQPFGKFFQRAFARKISRSRAEESRENYAKIGGKSPILELTKAQADALEAKLGPGFKTYIAMRAWKPFTEEAVDQLVQDGCERIVGLPLYPHRTRAMSLSSFKELRRVLKEKAPELPLHEVCCYPTAEGFLDAWADRIRETLATVPEQHRAETHIVFSAHGIPQKLVDDGDPYLNHILATVTGVMERLGNRPHTLAFQSRATPVKWLEPETGEALADLAKRGIVHVAVVPIAFLTEHIETLFELDMLLKEPALEAGIKGYYRVPAVGTHPRLIDALAELVTNALTPGGLLPCGLSSPPSGKCPMLGATTA